MNFLKCVRKGFFRILQGRLWGSGCTRGAENLYGESFWSTITYQILGRFWEVLQQNFYSRFGITHIYSKFFPKIFTIFLTKKSTEKSWSYECAPFLKLWQKRYRITDTIFWLCTHIKISIAIENYFQFSGSNFGSAILNFENLMTDSESATQNTL